MKMQKKIQSLILFLSFIFLFSAIAISIMSSKGEFCLNLTNKTFVNSIDQNSTESPVFSYILSYPIEINSDYDLQDYSTSGFGSKEFPFVIEGYNISSGSSASFFAISIRDTSKYFIIRNCYLNTYEEYSNDFGIRILDTAEGTATISNNIIIGTDDAIYISDSPSCNISNNFCEDNNQALMLKHSPNSIIFNNTIVNNYEGIEIDRSKNVIIANNTCSKNTINGIETYMETEGCLFFGNILQANERYGIDIHSYSSKNTIYGNTFINNNIDGGSQASDRGKRNKWYNSKTMEGNFWSNLGDSCNYKIDGDARTKDLYPLNRDQSCPNPKIGSSLAIAIPIAAFAAILAYLTPKYIIPYHREKSIFSRLREFIFKFRMWFYGLLGLVFSAGCVITFFGWYVYIWSGDINSALITGAVLGCSALIIGIPLVISIVLKQRKRTEATKL